MEYEALKRILKTKLKADAIEQRFSALKSQAEAGWNPQGQFTAAWLRRTVKHIDELWYEGRMLVALRSAYKRVDIGLGLKNRDDRIAGYVQECNGDDEISLHMNQKLFSELEFGQGPYGYHSGGLLCKERLVCFLHVLLHETVHLLFCMLEKLRMCPKMRDHGSYFNRVVLNLFGQTDSQHGLLPGYQQTSDLQTLRRCVLPGSQVEYFSRGKWTQGTVIRRGSKWVYVRDTSGAEIKAHIGLIRLN